MILWSVAKKSIVCASSRAFSPKSRPSKSRNLQMTECVTGWWRTRRIDGTAVWLLFSVPQEAVVGLEAQLIRRCSRKLNYIVGKERGRFFGKIQVSSGTTMTLKKLEIELYCWQNDCFIWVCVLEDGFSVCQPSQMGRRRYLLCLEEQILTLESRSTMAFVNPYSRTSLPR